MSGGKSSFPSDIATPPGSPRWQAMGPMRWRKVSIFAVLPLLAGLWLWYATRGPEISRAENGPEFAHQEASPTSSDTRVQTADASGIDRPPGDAGVVLVPAGWAFDDSNGNGIHRVVSDAKVALEGRSARIESQLNDSPWQGLGTLLQTIDAGALDGAAVQFSVSLKLQGERSAASLWIRADDKDGRVIVEHRSGRSDVISGTRDWASYSIGIKIPAEAARIVYGVDTSGVGTVWADEAQVTVSGEKSQRGTGHGRYHTRKVPPALPEPDNLSFDAAVRWDLSARATER